VNNFVSEIKRKKGESFEAFMRRVKKRWMQSGKILQARKIQFFAPKKSKNMQKKHTVSRKKKYSKIEYLQKIGKLPIEDNKFSR
jgi:hypothetical protein